MEDIIIPLQIPHDILITLNQKEEDLRNQFQLSIAIMLFQQEKLTFGKAVQLSGVDRYEFEKALFKNGIYVNNASSDGAFSDAEKVSI